MFRVSPWINYTPSGSPNSRELSNNNPANMDDDVDMDAPEISTLREENTPPPIRTSKFRVKLLVKDNKKGSSISSNRSSRKQPAGPTPGRSEDDAEDEDEEDQLIDDDDDDIQPSTSISAVTIAPPPQAKLSARGKVAQKRKSRNVKGEPEKKVRDKQAESNVAEEADNWDAQSGSIIVSEPPASKAPAKKKAAPRKTPGTVQRSKGKASSKVAKATPALPVEDVAAMSETYTGTAPSSPVPQEKASPEPEVALPVNTAAPSAGEQNLEAVPLPIYPLPSKPFPVQPPPKIGTGFAPVVPLDRSGNKVRHWRTANREIRGIAGGRWFARSWVGDKESEFSLATASNTAVLKASQLDGDKGLSSASISKMSAMSISAPPSGKGSGRSKVSKALSAASVGPSRAGSIVPDSHANAGTASVRAPTKMRTIVAAPTSDIDVDSDAAAQGS
ncbi:hypothetical protein SERLA73DRAFT_164841 [Serpula lacrymans var. lacrymans S7.3]|uniref:Uncharacterized protein n=2 Tax=Serpula lacrymans var. lacrymans TaxID=341189 RepID=F8PFJ6_SERL3|nr:uncharacterized protein SERLADRAFT_455857 [Serpula lacrymans var. lacrymans S7.9]EGO05285.1 hypothetical protein SERLA73DRAFT_164841 [Serpula lacrymans var. lacrymans S7.3]EGO31143.1 hypothetical protein SERLADRAFT_455857 [Serpula lacrymans var. lacrymans S7.9]